MQMANLMGVDNQFGRKGLQQIAIYILKLKLNKFSGEWIEILIIK